MDLPAAEPALAQPSDRCPLMELPTELRTIIYGLALQHIIDAIYDEAPAYTQLWRPVKRFRSDPDRVPFYTGALALTHTNRAIRAESLDTLAARMLAYVDRSQDEVEDFACNAVLRLTGETHDDPDVEVDMNALLKEETKVNKLSNSALQVKYICYMMAWTKGG